MNRMNFAERDTKSSVYITDRLYALHALAVISVHDALKDTDNKKSLHQIAVHDDFLKNAQDSLLYRYLLVFGRNNVPMLRTYLEEVDKILPEDVDAQVSEIANKLSKHF